MATNVVLKARTCAVINGTAYAKSSWLLQTNSALTVDTSSQTWVQQIPNSVIAVTGSPSSGQVPEWNGTAWVPTTVSAGDMNEQEAGLIAPGGRGWRYDHAALVSNRGYVARFVPSRNYVITLVAFAIGTASGSNDPLEIAVYDSTLSTKLATTGAVSGLLNSGTGVKTTSFSISLTAGTVYYGAFASQSTATLTMANFDQALNAPRLFGTSAPQTLFGDGSTSYPLPTPFVIGANAAIFPVLAFRES